MSNANAASLATVADPVAASYQARVDFLVELAERLHLYGTTAQRLEGAVVATAHKLGLECEPWSNPTGMILTFHDAAHASGDGDSTRTRVLRLPLGENDLYRLAETDRIAEEVIAGRMGLEQAHAAMAELDRAPGWRAQALEVVAFGLAAAGVAGLFRLPWLDIGVAAVNGLLIAWLAQYAAKRAQLREALDAVAAVMVATVTILVASFIAPLNQNTVIIASLVVLLPGLALTNAVNELSSKHLMSGTGRFAGALTTVVQLAVGVIIALYTADLLGLEPQVRAQRPQGEWVEWVALLAAAYAFAVLFKAHRRDYPRVMLAAAAGYLIARYAGDAFGRPAGVFLSALAMTAAGNAYARWWNRPGAIIRVPGIIMLVPGSISLRGLLDLLQTQDVGAGQEAILAVLNILIALIAGLLFGNLLLSARRNL